MVIRLLAIVHPWHYFSVLKSNRFATIQNLDSSPPPPRPPPAPGLGLGGKEVWRVGDMLIPWLTVKASLTVFELHI